MDNEPANGILNLNKPAGISSRQAIDHVKRLVRPTKVGHAGTLDPLASGVLVVCIGQTTRLVQFIQQMPKRYRAEFLLGRTSPTEDIEGEITVLANPPIAAIAQLNLACQRFTGNIEQRPPAFSALKVAGRRAYAIARRGQEVQLAPRPVTIHELAVVDYHYPHLLLDIRCSAGTYVRSLGRDLAESLGTGAVMSALVRTEVGSFHLDRAIDLQDLTPSTLRERIVPPELALMGLPRMVLNEHEIQELRYGRSVSSARQPGLLAEARVVAVDIDGNVLAILERRGESDLWPAINFVGRS
jgi:tRNA pseudouridine55 synthase